MENKTMTRMYKETEAARRAYRDYCVWLETVLRLLLSDAAWHAARRGLDMAAADMDTSAAGR
jgi:hypothetical protein